MPPRPEDHGPPEAASAFARAELPELGALYRSLLGAMLRRRPPLTSTRPFTLHFVGPRFTEPEIAAYRSLCGFATSAGVPPTFFFVAAQRPLLALALDRRFPFAPLGMVHLEVTITIDSSIDFTRPYAIVCASGAPTARPGGQELVLELDFEQDGRRVARLGSRAFKRDHHGPKRDAKALEPPAGRRHAVLDFDLALVRSYCRVSGDWNPIHWSRLLARFFGFRAPIAHGMLAFARVLASLPSASESSETRSLTFEARFGRPLLLPARAELFVDDHDGSFALFSHDGRDRHLIGRLKTTPATP
jgi:MaoC like domain